MGRTVLLSTCGRLTTLPQLFRYRLVAMATFLLLMGLSSLAGTPVHADSPAAVLRASDAAGIPAAPTIRDDRQYVFSIGMLTRVTDGAITLGFDDGQTQTYYVDAATTIHTPSGDVEHLADLAIGNMVIVITEEHQTTAVIVVNSGGPHFAEGGPYDVGDGE